MSLRCPQCAIDVEPTWEWCHGCGYDPNGRRTTAATAPPPTLVPAPPPAPIPLPPSPGPKRPRPSEPVIAAAIGLALIIGAVTVVVVLGRDRPSERAGTDEQATAGRSESAYAELTTVVPTAARTTTTRSAPPTTQARTTTTKRWLRAPEWRPWSAPDGSFTVELPDEPVVQDVTEAFEGFSQATRAIAELQDQSAMVLWADLEPGISIPDPAAALDASADGMVEEGLPVTHRQHGTFAGNPSLSITGTAGVQEIDALLFLSGTRLYLFMTAAHSAVDSGFDRFRDSFRTP